MSITDITCTTLTIDNWNQFENLFGEKGACGGCWCMYWRLKRSEFEKNKGVRNYSLMKNYVKDGFIPGLIAFDGNDPVGWCSIGKRTDFSTLSRSRILKKIDDQPVWSIVCFFVKKEFRYKGVSTILIEACKDFVIKQGGSIIEAYPIEPKKDKMPDVFAWTGFASSFRKAGFIEVKRRSETRPIMRFALS